MKFIIFFFYPSFLTFLLFCPYLNPEVSAFFNFLPISLCGVQLPVGLNYSAVSGEEKDDRADEGDK